MEFGYVELLWIQSSPFIDLYQGEMNEFRKSLVQKAFKKMDANKNGFVNLDDVKLFWNAKFDPKVLSGEMTEIGWRNR